MEIERADYITSPLRIHFMQFLQLMRDLYLISSDSVGLGYISSNVTTLLIGELKEYVRKLSRTILTHYPNIFLERLRKHKKRYREESKCQDRDSNPGPTECEEWTLTTRL